MQNNLTISKFDELYGNESNQSYFISTNSRWGKDRWGGGGSSSITETFMAEFQAVSRMF